jgi:hypothetical protein
VTPAKEPPVALEQGGADGDTALGQTLTGLFEGDLQHGVVVQFLCHRASSTSLDATPRNLDQEVAKHFQGTAEERILLALRLGREALDVFHTTLPPGTTLDEAREILRRNKQRGRRSSKVMEAPRG